LSADPPPLFPNMPSSEQILANLHTIANQGQTPAAIWHILALMALLALVSGWKPTHRTVAALLVLPLVSVSVIASVYGNPLNASTFAVLALLLGILGLRVPPVAVGHPPRWALVFGLATVTFGLAYPHFVDSGSVLWYLYAAPTGLLPCPTLSLVIGVALLVDGLGARAWARVLAVVGLCYGIFGVARLGVVLDVGLIVGAAALLVRSLKMVSRPTEAMR